ncbi:MAG: polysaccharide deacetylase family protein [Candidatus Nomurabacteria bacterium]|nr:MAG: polysaccharide deacetylase family protein [Candidatus Nomurabacteria bacterium]
MNIKLLQAILNIGKSIYWFMAAALLPTKSGAVVLTYHSVGDNGFSFTVSKKVFERQLKYIKNKKWNVVSLPELVVMLKKKRKIPLKTVAITFDDAYSDFIENALPVLEKYEIPATIFVPTDFVGRSMNNVDGALPLLNWSHLINLAAHPLVTIGSHTKSHLVLPDVTNLDLLSLELKESRETLNSKLNIDCRYFAYPKGKRSERIEAEVAKYYDVAFGTRPGRVTVDNSNMLHLNRKGVYSWTTFEKFKFLLKR